MLVMCGANELSVNLVTILLIRVNSGHIPRALVVDRFRVAPRFRTNTSP
jgi:hypothetical protein